MTRTRIPRGLELDGLSPEEAFAVLGNDIRLDVIRVLWRADAAHVYDDGSDAVETVSYSELQAEVDIDDNGKFNYHLSRLVPHFVRRTDDGYRLSGAGKRIARTVIAVSSADQIDVATELETACPLCGGSVTATYEDHWLRMRCTECAGLFGDEAPTGTLFLTSFPAAGLRGRDPEEALAAGLYRCALDITYLLYGLCRACGGPISSTVAVCDDHDDHADRPCVSCGTPFPVWATMRCETCGFAKRLPVEMFATGLAVVAGMSDDRAFDGETLTVLEAVELIRNRVETTVSEAPRRISIEIERETTVTVTFDGEMNVLEVDRGRRRDVVTT